MTVTTDAVPGVTTVLLSFTVGACAEAAAGLNASPIAMAMAVTTRDDDCESRSHFFCPWGIMSDLVSGSGDDADLSLSTDSAIAISDICLTNSSRNGRAHTARTITAQL